MLDWESVRSDIHANAASPYLYEDEEEDDEDEDILAFRNYVRYGWAAEEAEEAQGKRSNLELPQPVQHLAVGCDLALTLGHLALTLGLSFFAVQRRSGRLQVSRSPRILQYRAL